MSSPLVESKKDSHSDNAQPARFNANLSQKIETARDKIQNFENPITDKEVGDVHNAFDSERMHEESKKVNKEFNRRLDEIEQGKLGKPLSLGMPNAILRNAGIENKEMKIFGSKIISKLNKHGYRAKDLTNLPNAVQAPIAVFKGSQEGSFAVLTEIEINNKNILVVISKGKGSDIDFNIVSSVYRKDGKGVIDWINNNKITYSNKEKSLNYLRTSALIADSTNNTEIIFTTKIEKEIETARDIIQNFDNPISDKEVGDVQFMISPNHKSKQLQIINKTNPAPNDYNLWVRNESDILTAEEAFRTAFEDGEMYPDFTTKDMQEALDKGSITVYSSYPIKDGTFVTPSRMNAQDYAGGGDGRVYSKEVKLEDIAWLDESEGQYAKVQFMHTPNGQVYGAKLPDGTIYFNPELLNMDTAFHEFSHLWEQMMPRAWAKGLALFKQTKTGKELFSKLKGEGNYSNLTDEQLWSEAMNTYIGERGAELYENKPRGVMAQFREWLSDLFYKLGQAFGIKKPMTPFTTFEEFAHRVIDDIQGGRELLGENHIPKSEIPNIIRAMSNADLEMMLLDMGVIEKGKCA